MNRCMKLTLTTIGLLVLVAVTAPDAWRWWTVGLIVLVYGIVFGLGTSFIGMNFFLVALCRGEGNEKRIALTFDDGPDPETTPAILDTLAAEEVCATFFCIGERVRAHPDIASRIVEEGHVIGNHTMRHGWWTNFLFGKLLERELAEAQAAIASVTGREPVYIRTPMGLTNPHYTGVLGRLGLKLVGWDLRGFDLSGQGARAVIERVRRRVRPGSIVALHASGVRVEVAIDIVKGLVKALGEDGYSFVGVDAFDVEAET